MKDIDEAIQHCEDIAQQQDMLKGRYDNASGYTRSGNEAIRTSDAKECEKCAADYRQLAEWFKELKQLREQTRWIPVSERLPETDNENSINSFNVLLWVKNKTHPEEAQIFLGKLRHIDGDDGSGNFWGIKTEPCEWTIWGWCYFNEPEVIAWMPLPASYEPQERSKE